MLTVNMESKNAGLYANLFYYNEQTGELEFVSAGQIDADGNVELENAANALANFCICFVKKCHTLQMDFSYFEYGRKQSFHTFFIANPK